MGVVHPAADSRKGEDLAERDASRDELLTTLTGNERLIHELNAINERLLDSHMIDFGSADGIESTCVQHLCPRAVQGGPLARAYAAL